MKEKNCFGSLLFRFSVMRSMVHGKETETASAETLEIKRRSNNTPRSGHLARRLTELTTRNCYPS